MKSRAIVRALGGMQIVKPPSKVKKGQNYHFLLPMCVDNLFLHRIRDYQLVSQPLCNLVKDKILPSNQVVVVL
jgi:hypothetical protein